MCIDSADKNYQNVSMCRNNVAISKTIQILLHVQHLLYALKERHALPSNNNPLATALAGKTI